MRVTRYLWVNNLPASTTEEELRDVLQSFGKIQNVRIHSEDFHFGAVVAFADTQSATRAIQSTIKCNKTVLSLQYCESSGHLALQSHDAVNTSESSKSEPKSLIVPESRERISMDFAKNDRPSDSPNSSDCANNTRSHHSVTRDMSSTHDSPVTESRRSIKQRGLRIEHLPLRSSDTNLREGIFHEYKKHGKISSVVIKGHYEKRYSIVTFKRHEDAVRALEASKGKVFFGTPIVVSLHDGLDVEDPDLCPPELALDEYHPKATKTLFVGNLCSSTVTQEELRKAFRSFGDILEIDIKTQANQPNTSYAFVQYSDIKSVVRALSSQDTVRIGGKSVKLGFGKSQPTNVVWLDNLPPVTEDFLSHQFGKYGHLTHVVLDRKASKALLYFDAIEMAQRALSETRNRTILGRKVHLDFAGYECQVAFMRHLGINDSFGIAYEDYRERLKQLLSLWPQCGLPFLGRQKFLEDILKESKSFHKSSGRSYRSLSKHSSIDRDAPRNKHRSGNKHVDSKANRHNHRKGDRDHSKDSLSSSPNRHSRTDHLTSRKRHKFSSHKKPSELSPSNSRSSIKSNSRSQKASSPQPTSNSRPGSARFPTKDNSHYLDATDDVSSGSLSLDLNDIETFHPSPTKSVSRDLSSHHRQTFSSSLKSHRSSRSIDPQKRVTRNSSSPDTETSNGLSRSSRKSRGHQDVDTSERSHRGVRHALQYSRSNNATSSPFCKKDALTRQSKKQDDRKWEKSKSISLPHDTLTKLEQERAKLLRELSLLNNEVGMRRTRNSDISRTSDINSLNLCHTDSGETSVSRGSSVPQHSIAKTTPVSDLQENFNSTVSSGEQNYISPVIKTEATTSLSRHITVHTTENKCSPQSTGHGLLSPPHNNIQGDPSLSDHPKSTSPKPHSVPTSVDNFRDTKIVAPLTPADFDVPPPPPPPLPENLKNSLFINTCLDSTTATLKSPVTKASYTETLNDSSRSIDCSLEERIRLLDVQLSKSEKARPAVDYSKFRIRRKVDATIISSSSSVHMEPAAVMSPVSSVPKMSCSPLSVHTRMGDRSRYPDYTMSTSITSIAVESSPLSAVSNSPLPLGPHADTSEFVKSMLSSKPITGTTDPALILSTLDNKRDSTLRFSCATPTISTPVSSMQSHSTNDTPVTSNYVLFANHRTRHLGLFDSLHSISHATHGSCVGSQPIGVATRMPSASSPPKCPGNEHNARNSSAGENNDNVPKVVDSSLTPTVQHTFPTGSVCAKSLTPQHRSSSVSAEIAVKNSESIDKLRLQNAAKGEPDPSFDTSQKSKATRMPKAKHKQISRPGPVLDDSIFSNVKNNTALATKKRKFQETENIKKSGDRCSTSPSKLAVDSSSVSKKRRTSSIFSDQTKDKSCTALKQTQSPVQPSKLSKSLQPNRVDTSNPARTKKKSHAKKSVADTSNSKPELTYESMYDKIKRRASKDANQTEPKRKMQKSTSPSSSTAKHRGASAKRVISTLIDSDTDECFSDTSDIKSTSGDIRSTDVKDSKPRKSVNISPTRVFVSKSTNSSHRSSKSSRFRAKKGMNNKNARSQQVENSEFTPQSKLSSSRKSTQNRRFSGKTNDAVKCAKNRKQRGDVHTSAKTSVAKLVSKARHSLVKHVFASGTDSSSSSAESSERLPVNASPRSYSSCVSDSSHLSRSCSPEDLGADAAVRHTFGAFATSTGQVISKDQKHERSSSVKAASQLQSPDDRTTSTLKSTPPTLPMLDSCSNADPPLNEKFHTSDPNEWNIFSSLTKHSTPKWHLPGNDTANPCDFDEDLPSLEKHDHSDSVEIDNSISMAEADPMHKNEQNGPFADTDYIPPVVSGLDNSPEILSGTSRSLQPDIIEEVVYDAIEFHEAGDEHSFFGCNSQENDHSIVLKPESSSEEIVQDIGSVHELGVVSQPAASIMAPTSLNTDTPCQETVVQQPLNQVSSFSTEQQSTPSTVSTQLSRNFSGVTKPVLLTVPRSHSLASGVTILPASLNQLNSVKPIPVDQRHVALIIPATPVSSILSLKSTATTLQSAPTVVYTSPTFSVTSPICMVHPQQPFIFKQIDPEMHMVENPSIPANANLCVAHTDPSSLSIGFHAPVLRALPASLSINSGTSCHSDFTTYVQRVIERVKQEKVEETVQQKEKCKRPKRTSVSNITVSGTLTTSSSTLPLSSSILPETVSQQSPPTIQEHVSVSQLVDPITKLDPCGQVSIECSNSCNTSSLSGSTLPPTSLEDVQVSLSSITSDTCTTISNGFPPLTSFSLSESTATTNTMASVGSVLQPVVLNTESMGLQDSLAYSNTLTKHAPIEMLTPLHVLTLVATSTSTSSDAISLVPIPSASSQTPAPQSITESGVDHLVSGISCLANMDTLNTLPSVTTSNIGQLTAQFSNYSFNYLYSLLREHHQSNGLNSTAIATGSCQQPPTLSEIPHSTDPSDFLATVAAMTSVEPAPVELTRPIPSSQIYPSQYWSGPFPDVKGFPVSWQGRLSLKNEEIFAYMHYISGNRDLLKDCMAAAREATATPDTDPSSPHLLKIVQRMRLEPSQLNGVYRKLHQTSDFCMCLTLATAPPLTPETSIISERFRMNNILQQVFIKYLIDKCAAGIINVCHPCTQQNLYVIHIFPPCEFSRIQLETTAPALQANLSKCCTPYLLVVITTV